MTMPETRTTPRHTLDELMTLRRDELHRIVCDGHALDPDVLAGRQYLGVDLSLPGWARKLLWQTFRKTFVRDDRTGLVRGWNVRMEQHGVDGPRIPMRDGDGNPKTFGHYVVRSADGTRFPQGFAGPNYLDYGTAGNHVHDPGRFGLTPLVAVEAGNQDLLLGWEVFRVGPALLPLPLYFALRYEGPVENVISPPRPTHLGI